MPTSSTGSTPGQQESETLHAPPAFDGLAERDHGKLVRLHVGGARVLELIAEGEPLPIVLRELMMMLEEQVEGMLGSVLLASEDGKRLHHGAAPSLPSSYVVAIDGVGIGPCAGSCGTAAYLKRPVLVADIATDPLWADSRHLALAAGLGSCWSTPILSKAGDVLGTFAMYHRQPLDPWPNDLALMRFAARLARIAIERDLALRERERDRKEKERLLADRERALEILSVAAHELRNPLGALVLRLETLQLRLRGSPVPVPLAEEQANAARRQLGRLDQLVGQLLDVSRLSTGRLALHLVDTDLVAVASEVVERFAASAERQGCRLRLVADGPVWGHWDAMRIDQIATNLLSNAIKYGRGEPVEVLVQGDQQRARLQVRDAGIGIALEQQERIFGRFERGVADHEFAGTGLGLWITGQIVEALGGTIQVASRPGQGSAFTVDLPRR